MIYRLFHVQLVSIWHWCMELHLELLTKPEPGCERDLVDLRKQLFAYDGLLCLWMSSIPLCFHRHMLHSWYFADLHAAIIFSSGSYCKLSTSPVHSVICIFCFIFKHDFIGFYILHKHLIMRSLSFRLFLPNLSVWLFHCKWELFLSTDVIKFKL